MDVYSYCEESTPSSDQDGESMRLRSMQGNLQLDTREFLLGE